MDPRTDYLLQILDKIGGPLVTALARGDHVARGSGVDPDEAAGQDAQSIAQLLARCVQMSIEIGGMMELDMTDSEKADRLRLALMVLAGPLVAAQYRHDGRVPGDAEQKKILTGLEAVLAFSQNFSPSAANAAELDGSDDPVLAGADMIRSMRCFTSVINAVGAFPFGQPEKKLIQDVSSRITARAEELAAALLPEASNADKLLLIKILADIYAECHAEEMRLMLAKGQEDPDTRQGLDTVWKRFDIRAAMLEALADNLAPGEKAPRPASAIDVSASSEQGSDTQAAESEQPPASVNTPSIFSASPAASPESAAPPPAPASADPPPGGFNPMSMFAKKDPEEEGVPADPASEPESTPPPPPSSPVPETPDASTQPSPENNADESGEDGGDSDSGTEGGSGSDAPPGNPMSFFKKEE